MATASPGIPAPPPMSPLSSSGRDSSPLSEIPAGVSLHDMDEDEHEQEQNQDHDHDQDEEPAPDSDAETDRMPGQTPRRNRDILNDGRIFERTPTKLAAQVEAESDMPSSPPTRPRDTDTPPIGELQSPTLDLLAEAAATQETESRKRKHPSQPARDREGDEPARKRLASADREEGEGDGDITMADAEDRSTDTTGPDAEEDQEDQAEGNVEGEPRSRKQTRSTSKRHDTREEAEADLEHEDPTEGTHNEEENEVDPDEEAEAAAMKKKSAHDQLSGIEKRFTAFREKLYAERIAQLDVEIDQLHSESHPEYLAMMVAVDARRDERVRIADKELQYKKESLERCAVARRSQIHSQYFQGIRETRERTLAELGHLWYNIQHERRRQANPVPEFGLRWPDSQTQRVRHAVAYNTEVSILSGVAKHEGMPAAPSMHGASMEELDDDFEAINRGRRQTSQPQRLPRPVYTDYTGPFGQGVLGAAGEQWLERTAWANPNSARHPHTSLPPRQHHHQEPRRPSPIPSASTSQAQQSNGASLLHRNISPETSRAATLLGGGMKVATGEEPSIKNEAISQTSGA